MRCSASRLRRPVLMARWSVLRATRQARAASEMESLAMGRASLWGWVRGSQAMIRQGGSRREGAASDNRLYVTDGLPISLTVLGPECRQPSGCLQTERYIYR